MDYADLINALNTTINDLQGQVLRYQDTLDHLELDGVPGTDVSDEDVRDALRILAQASAKIA